MKGHDEIRNMLAAHAGGDLPLEDQALVEQHLRDCPTCRYELAQLQAVVQAVRATPDLEAPAWLASRIMARVRDEPVRQRGWLARLFLPLHIKLPLEALALVLVCMSAWYVMQDVERSQQSSQMAPAPEMRSSASTGASVKDQVSPSAPQEPGKPSADVIGPTPAASRKESRPGAPTASPEIQETRSAPVSAPPPQAVTDRAERMDRATSVSGAAPMAPAASREPAAETPAPMAERKMDVRKMATKRRAETSDSSLNAAVSPKLRLRLIVADREPVSDQLYSVVQRLGGLIVDSRSGSAVVRVEAVRLPTLIEQVGKLGRVVERPAGELPRDGWVELQIFW